MPFRPDRPQMPGMGPRDAARWRDPTPEEIDKAKAFAKENFPNRFAAYERLPENTRLRWAATRRMVQQWRRLQYMQEQQPEMYDAIFGEQKAMDEAFGLWRDVREGKPGAEEKLSAKIAEIVDNQLNERKARIEKLEKMLQEQKEQLAKDRDRRDELIENRREQLEKDTRPPREDKGDANETVPPKGK
jgi:gas vesicle protein